MTNPYEHIARMQKAQKIADWLEAGGIGPASLIAASDDDWKLAAQGAQVKVHPTLGVSLETRREVIDLMDARIKARQLIAKSGGELL